MRKLGRGFAPCILGGVIKRRFRGLNKKEAADFRTYLQQILMREGSTEYCIFVCFDHLMFAKHPLELEDRLGGVPIPISFFFGDRDWVLRDGGEAVLEKN